MLRLNDIDEVSIEVTTDTSLPAWSHSMLNAIATCPTAGLMTYVANKVMSNPARAMALEAGAASHETYAAARLWQIGKHQGLGEHAAYHGDRLFGTDRHESMVLAAAEAGDDQRNAMLRFCLEAFYTSGFYDDPSDKRRTFVNIEEALIAYLDSINWKEDIWVEDADNPEARVGIEIPLDITITYAYDTRKHDGPLDAFEMRFIGTADGLSLNRRGNLRLQENKTASRLGEAWAMSFEMSHQVTGYMLALETILGKKIEDCAVNGMCIPLPRSYDAGGLMTQIVLRRDTHYRAFLEWMLHLTQVIETYGHDPVNAPKHTGACNKYFRPCSLIPLCASPDEDREFMLDNMVTRDASPTEEALDD